MIQVGLFAEDEGHRSLLSGLMRRLADEEGIVVGINPRNAQGGSPWVRRALRHYVADLATGHDSFLDVLVVAIDANSDGVAARRQLIKRLVGDSYAGTLVTAIPDPHVECWYLADPYAVSRAIGQSYRVEVPSTIKKGQSYKPVLRSAFLQGGVDPPGGGPEYGEAIAAVMDLRVASKRPELEQFVSDARAALRRAAAAAVDRS